MIPDSEVSIEQDPVEAEKIVQEKVITDDEVSEFIDEPAFIEPVVVEEEDVATISATIPEIPEDIGGEDESDDEITSEDQASKKSNSIKLDDEGL